MSLLPRLIKIRILCFFIFNSPISLGFFPSLIQESLSFCVWLLQQFTHLNLFNIVIFCSRMPLLLLKCNLCLTTLNIFPSFRDSVHRKIMHYYLKRLIVFKNKILHVLPIGLTKECCIIFNNKSCVNLVKQILQF